MSFKVVNTIHLPGLDFGEKLLEPLDATLVNGFWRTEDELISNAADADAVICTGPLQPFTRRVLGVLSRCRIVASFGAAYDRIDLEAATECSTVVTNTPDYCIDELSGRAIALMLALGYKLFQVQGNMKLISALGQVVKTFTLIQYAVGGAGSKKIALRRFYS